MIAAAVCWSFGGLFIKFIPWSAMSIISVRAMFAALVYIIYRRSAKIDFTFSNVLTAVCVSATTILFVFANKLTTAGAAVLLQFTAPVFIILIRFIIFKKKPTVSSCIAVAVTLVGMLLFFADRLEEGQLLGNLLAIASGLAFAGVFVCNNRPETNPDHALVLGFLINTVVGLPFLFMEATADPLAWGSGIAMGIMQVGLGYIFFSKGIKKTSALLACLISAAEPVLNPIWVFLAGIWGWLPMIETPGRYALIGGVVIVLTIVSYNIWVERTAEKETSL